ncbi:MAG: signal peptidase I [Candidatus Kapabacteria bacterium]|nr:signal peptidase I [Candidatus Kapabacteria bacterium]MCS7169595.1 signal peptidase I [Candidatus Kapabacteria bacterium]MDW8225872.1 signal peptidase I [Bacteroidota bacterium]
MVQLRELARSAWAQYREARRRRKAQRRKPRSPGEAVTSWVRSLLGALLIVMVLNGLAIASFVVPTGSMEGTVQAGDFLFVNRVVFGPSTPQIIPFFNIALPYMRLPGLRQPQRGDVIVFIFPGYRDEVEPREFQYYLKRCVAVAGDTVELRNKRLFVNGVEQPLPPHAVVTHLPPPPGDQYRTFPRGRGYTRDNYGPIRVPKRGDTIGLSLSTLLEWDTFIRREGHAIAVRDGKILIDGKPASFYVVERDYCFGLGDNRDNSEDSRYWGFIPVDNVVGRPMMVYWSWDPLIPLSSFLDKLGSIRWGRIGTLVK